MSFARKVVRYLPLITAVAGVVIVYFSTLPEDNLVALGVITVGLGCLLASIWYAANPFLQTERRYFALRQEVVEFINLVRVLNRAVTQGSSDRAERTKKLMYESIERIAAVAGKEGTAD